MFVQPSYRESCSGISQTIKSSSCGSYRGAIDFWLLAKIRTRAAPVNDDHPHEIGMRACAGSHAAHLVTPRKSTRR